MDIVLVVINSVRISARDSVLNIGKKIICKDDSIDNN